jgi:uncharacterized protein DUF4352
VRKLVSLALTLAFVASFSFSAGIATAAPAPSHQVARSAAQEIGDTITVTDTDGNDVAEATVEDVVDPFEDMEQNPKKGLRFVSVEVTIENTGKDTLTVTPGNIGVVDDKGIIYVGVDVDRTDNVDPLVETDLEPGDSISGGLAVGIPEDGEIAQIVWLVGQGMLPILVNNLDPVALGDPVTLYTTDYAEEASVTTEDVVDNFDDLASGAKPQSGLKFVGVTVTFENTGEEAFTPNPGSVFLGTTDGIFWAPESSVDRSSDAIDETPDLTDDPVDAGDSVTGFVGFQIPEDLDIAYVMYLPDTTRLIRIYDANVEDNGTATAGEDNKNDGGLGPIGKTTPTPSSGSKKTPTASGDECAGATDWQDVTLDTLGTWGGVFRNLDLSNPDAAAANDARDGADTIRDLVAQQRDSNPPPAAEELNDMLVQAYEDSAQALEDIADAIDAGDSAAFQDAIQTISDIGSSFTEGDVADTLNELKSTCPEIDQL